MTFLSPLSLAIIANMNLLDYLRDPQLLIETLVSTYGVWMVAIVALIVFIESGVLFPVLPGDSLLFTLGMLHSLIHLPVWVTALILLAAAVAGSQVGYALGRVFGARLFRDDARFLKTEYLDSAEEFFTRYGGRSIVLARFVPFVRTFVPVAAGMARYPGGKFLTWNLIGATIWAVGLTFAGVLLGGIPLIRNNIEIMAIIIVLVSMIPVFISITKGWLARRSESSQPKLGKK